MPNVGGQKYKIIVLYQILLEQTDENHPMNATEIITALKEKGIPAERKGIYKDISTLQEADVDIIKNDKGYYIGSRTFELPELKLLVDAVGASKFISEKKSKELLDKIGTLTSGEQAKQLSRQVVVPDRVKTDNEKIFYTIDVIYQCIDENKKMSFQYEEWGTDKKKVLRRDGAKYMVSPAFLIRNDENYYLVAFDDSSSEIRHYRVDKIVSAKMEEVDRDGIEERKNLVPQEYAKNHVSMFAGQETTVTLKCPKKLCGVLLDKFGTDISIREDGEFIRARIPVAVSPQFFGWAVGIGATITAPEAAAEAYKEHLQSILDL